MASILVIDKNPSRTNYSKELGMQVDVAYLCDEKVQRVTKSNMTIDTSIIYNYDHVILCGSDALKVFSRATGINDVTGRAVPAKEIDGKKHESMFAIVSFGQKYFKPEIVPVLEQSVESITKQILNGKTEAKAINIAPITSEEDALEYLKDYCRPSKLLGLDSETSALYARDGYILGLCVSHHPDWGRYISAEAVTDNVLEELQSLIDDNEGLGREVVLHNIKFDDKFFTYHYNLTLQKAYMERRVHDTMVQHYVLDERTGTHGLKQLAIKFTDLGDYDFELDEFKKSYCKSHGIKQEDFSYQYIPFDIMWPYAATDPLATLRLHLKFLPIIRKNDKLNRLYENILMPATNFLTKMEDRGVPVSKERLEKCKVFLYEKKRKLEEELYSLPEVAKFEAREGKVLNPNSPVQLRTFLFDICGITPLDKFTDTGQLSTDAEVLEKLGEKHKVAKLLLEIRKTLKILNTYIIKMIDNVDKDGRLRTGFSLHTTTSGRLSSSGKLNLQQLPRDDAMVKGCIVAPPGYRIVAKDQ